MIQYIWKPVGVGQLGQLLCIIWFALLYIAHISFHRDNFCPLLVSSYIYIYIYINWLSVEPLGYHLVNTLAGPYVKSILHATKKAMPLMVLSAHLTRQGLRWTDPSTAFETSLSPPSNYLPFSGYGICQLSGAWHWHHDAHISMSSEAVPSDNWQSSPTPSKVPKIPHVSAPSNSSFVPLEGDWWMPIL